MYKIFYFYSILWFLVSYAIPLYLLVFFYSNVITTLKISGQNLSARSMVYERIATQFTKCVIVITVVYFITLSFDSFYFLLGSFGVVKYRIGEPLQKVALFLMSLNSCCNPYIYIWFTFFSEVKVRYAQLTNLHNLLTNKLMPSTLQIFCIFRHICTTALTVFVNHYAKEIRSDSFNWVKLEYLIFIHHST